MEQSDIEKFIDDVGSLQLLSNYDATITYDDVDMVLSEEDHDLDLDNGYFVQTLLDGSRDIQTQDTINELPQPTSPPLNFDECDHEHCNKLNLNKIASGFHNINVNERINRVRTMLFPLTTNRVNDLMSVHTLRIRKRKLDGIDKSIQTYNNSTCFALKEVKVCSKTFSVVVGLFDQTIRRHAHEVAHEPTIMTRTSYTSNRRKEKWGVQRIIVKAFLTTVADDHGMECPTERWSQEKSPIEILPSQLTKIKVYNHYKTMWMSLAEGVVSYLTKFEIPDKPISHPVFVRYWNNDFSLLRISSQGSDFCDECTTLKDSIKVLSTTDVRYIA